MMSLRFHRAKTLPSVIEKLRIRISRRENVVVRISRGEIEHFFFFCRAFLKFHLEPDPKTRCAKPGFQRQFSEGEICISVDALYTPPNKTADGKSFVMERTFRRCSRKECINTQPKQSTDLIVLQ